MLNECEVLPILNWEYSLQRADGNQDLAKELMQMLVGELPTFRADINQAMTTNNLNDLKAHLHKLLGGCNYCGVPKLQKIVKTFEAAAKVGDESDFPTFITAFNQAVDEIIAAVNNDSQWHN